MSHSAAKLFQPVRVGALTLQHCVVYAPCTRFRADDAHVPTDAMAAYYAQRASVPGTLLIAEATLIAAKAGGYNNVPGIWSAAQVAGWKKVVDAVHAQGSYIYLQLWQLGRAAQPHDAVPRALTHDEILEYIELFGTAAHNAVHGAGFDGVEVHGAHGFLVDQFTQDVSNRRTDQWGGSIENRTRFALEVLKKIASVVGEERTAIRLSPFNPVQDMRMEHPEPTFAHLVRRIRETHPRFAFIHVVEPRIAGDNDRVAQAGESNDFLRAIWKTPESEANGSVYVAAGGYKPEIALETAETKGDLVAFGRYYTSNPDLPVRIRKGIPFTPYDRKTFYSPGLVGYTDQKFADSETEAKYEKLAKGREDVWTSL
ncbi:NADH:flavin oxidoreductase/NADH oxidase [Phellopilus nigrolimitatus]|nr:NADH:flavin oxidoreductase/NADH oxidase [Phellopilus nigrolimitatus]